MSHPKYQLFSIDVDAHLKKAASHTFGSPAHYPVELVRSALARGAQQVQVSLSKYHIQVDDDGKGLAPEAIQTLVRLMNPDVSVADKEAAVEALQTRDGMGLLAVFAANPDEVTIENAPLPPDKCSRLHFKGTGRFHMDQDAGIDKGARITLHTRPRKIENEQRMLDIFCRAVKADIRVNGESISGHDALNGQLAILELEPSRCIQGGQIGVPREGKLCRLQLLDRGIPWHHLTLPPVQGYIFDTAVEYRGDPSDAGSDLVPELLPYAEKLYQWLCKRYSNADSHYRERFEELIFTRCRLTGDVSLLHRFNPFKLYGSVFALDLAELKKKVAEGVVYAVPRNKEHLKYNTGGNGNTVLSLTRDQADLIINFLKIPVTFLAPMRQRLFSWWKLRCNIKNVRQRVLKFLTPVPKAILGGSQLSPSEITFLNVVNSRLEDQTYRFTASKAVMTNSRRPFPSVTDTVAGICLLRRSHPLVRQAVLAVEKDPENIELFLPFLDRN